MLMPVIPQKRPTLYETIRKLQLTTNLRLCLDAGDASSYSSGQKWLDRSGGGYDFFLGADGTVSATDPTFNGGAGQASANEYFSVDGGDYFTYDTTNETWINNLHKDGAKLTILTWVYRNGAGACGWLGTSGNNTSNVGIEYMVFGGAALFRVCKGSAGYALSNSATTVNDTAWNFVAVSIDEAAASGFWNINGGVTTFDPTFTTPSAANATYTANIGALGNASTPPASGNRIAAVAVWEGVSLTQDQVAALRAATRRRFGV